MAPTEHPSPDAEPRIIPLRPHARGPRDTSVFRDAVVRLAAAARDRGPAGVTVSLDVDVAHAPDAEPAARSVGCTTPPARRRPPPPRGASARGCRRWS
jgi:hypothetical protein